MEIDDIDLSTLDWLPLARRKELPTISAIYFALWCSELSSPPFREVLYVGKATSLVQRWAGHHRLPQLLRFSNVRLLWLPTPVEQLDKFEAACIQRFNPILNGGIVSEPSPPSHPRNGPRYPNKCPHCRYCGHFSGWDIYACEMEGIGKGKLTMTDGMDTITSERINLSTREYGFAFELTNRFASTAFDVQVEYCRHRVIASICKTCRELS